MTPFTISLPEDMKAFVDQQITREGFSTAEEYIRHLIEKEQLAQNATLEEPSIADKRLEELLLEGLDSDPIEATDEWWEQERAALVEQVYGTKPE